MDIKSGHPFWPLEHGLIGAFPALPGDLSCDVAVIGAGITGSLIARELASSGLDVVVLDRREAGWGSTAASTALLQYEIDTDLVELRTMYGQRFADEAYRACSQAIDDFEGHARDVDADVGFRRTGSLYFASSAKDARDFPGEFAARREAGLAVEWLDAGDVAERFGIQAPAAMWTPQAAVVDPYRFCRNALRQLVDRGASVYDRTEVTGWQDAGGGWLNLATHAGPHVRCRHLVIAAGYESQRWLKYRVARNHSSYALVTEPVGHLPFALEDNVAWESARPYLYLRSTDDGRVLVGGEDDKVDIASKRDAALPRKVERLLEKLSRLAGGRSFEPGFSWAGTFAETTDGLPYIGAPSKGDPRVHFAMAYGGNGITYSVIAADILRDAIHGRTHPRAALFGFGRIGR